MVVKNKFRDINHHSGMMAYISLLSNVRLTSLMDSGMMAHISLLSNVRLTGLMDSGMMSLCYPMLGLQV